MLSGRMGARLLHTVASKGLRLGPVVPVGLCRPITSQSGKETAGVSQMQPREEEQTVGLVRQIVEDYARREVTFVLPWADHTALAEILSSFKELMGKGVRREFLLDACLREEALFRALTKFGACSHRVLALFVEYFGMTYEDAMRFYADWADQLSGQAEKSVHQCLAVFLGRGIGAGRELRALVERCPAVLFSANGQEIDRCLEHISGFFSHSSVRSLLLHTPHICLLDPRGLESKYEYIYFHMGIESEELVQSFRWMDLELDQIMMRHEFLTKTGQYFIPDPKRPQFKKENPTVRKIFDTKDKEFATGVAQVTIEEWIMFQELSEQQRLWADKEKPYERIKPSMRKTFERRKKESREREEGEIELEHQQN